MPSLKGILLSIAVLAALIVTILAGCAGVSDLSHASARQRTFILYGNEDPEDLDILKERLDLFAGKNGYSLEQSAGTYTLRLPASLGRSDKLLASSVDIFLASPCQINVVCTSPNGRVSDTVFTAAELSRNNCLSMKVEELPVENETAAGEDLLTLDMNTPPSRRLILKLSQETADSLRSLESKGSELFLRDNNLYPGYERDYYVGIWTLEPDPDDPCLFYTDYNETDCLYGNEELLFYNLTHDPPAHRFNNRPVDDIIWEDPEDNTSSGAYQCREDALEDSFLFFRLNQALYADQLAQIKMLLLRRLDLLESPYAYGQTDSGSICVKIQSSRINMSVLKLLTSCDYSPISLKVQGTAAQLRPKYLHVRYDKEASALEIFLPSEAAAELNDLLHTLMQSSSGSKVPFQQIPIYLCVDNTPVARCTTDVFFDPGHMIFREIYMPVSSEDISWFAALVDEAANQHPKSVSSVYLSYFYDHKIERDTFDPYVTFPLKQRSPVSESEIAAKMREILPGTQVHLSDDSRILDLHMNLPLNEDLIERIFTLAPRLYEASSLNKEFFDIVRIYPFEPEGDERCWLIFEKDSDGSVSFSGYLFNGRLTPYKDEIIKAIEKDTFFRTMIPDQYSGWVYRDF